MTVSERITKHSVKVNGGSGVLVNTMSLDYSYVLTADHVLEDNDSANVVYNFRGEQLHIINVKRYPDVASRVEFDCALIQIEYIPNVEQFTLPSTLLEHRANLQIAGFPTSERQSTTPLKHYDGHMTSVHDEVITFTIDGIPGRDSIEGMSGGGVYHVKDNQPYLVGVECQMDSDHPELQFGRVQCRSLSRFEEIIRLYDLVPMVPSFLECFSRLKNNLFDFNVIEPRNVEGLHTALLEVADALVERGMPAPYTLMNQYKEQLLITEDKLEDIKDKHLWVSYFEFLIICILIDGVANANMEYIKSLERKRKILYSSDSKNWMRRLQDILLVAKNTLDKNGTMVITSPEDGADMQPSGLYTERIIKNIASVPSSGPFIKIDNAVDSVYKSFVVVHLNGLRKTCIVNREDDFGLLQGTNELLTLFRDSYNEIIK